MGIKAGDTFTVGKAYPVPKAREGRKGQIHLQVGDTLIATKQKNVFFAPCGREVRVNKKKYRALQLRFHDPSSDTAVEE